MSRHLPSTSGPRRQRGAALFVALMLLIVLSLLAVSASQVTSLQERMASAYRADEIAFERGEERLRGTERDLLAEVDPCYQEIVAAPETQLRSARAPMSISENMSRGVIGRALATRGSIGAGEASEVGSSNCIYFRVSAADFDTTDAADSSSSAIVQSIFVP